jgi:hypothetical protein
MNKFAIFQQDGALSSKMSNVMFNAMPPISGKYLLNRLYKK